MEISSRFVMRGIPGIVLAVWCAARAGAQTPFSASSSVPPARAWIQRSALPSARLSPAAAYDAHNGRTVVFGGFSGSSYLSDTWTWDGLEWQQVTTVTRPSARSGSAVAYDSTRGRTLLFGGINGSALGETWEFDGTQWFARSPSTAPSSRSGAAAAYDPLRKRVVLFGGYTGSVALSDTWEFDGTNWKKLTTASSPAARHTGRMVYDASRRRMVHFGGVDASAVAFADTWEFDGTNWQQGAAGPSARARVNLAYDSRRETVVLFGGTDLTTGNNETWEYDGAWTQKTPATSPSARNTGGSVYDSARGVVVMFGGSTNANTNGGTVQGTWEYDGTTWTQQTADSFTSPSGRRGGGMAYDAARARTYMYGGFSTAFNSESWFWDGIKWTQATVTTNPGVRADQAMVDEPTVSKVFHFGGSTGGSNPDSTHEYDGAAWISYSPTTRPAGREFPTAVWNAASAKVLMFGGATNSSTMRSDTWEWDPSSTTWTQRSPGSVPAARWRQHMAYDTDRQVAVMFGGNNNSVSFNDTWEFNGTNWTRITADGASGSPAKRYDGVFWYDPVRERSILFGGTTGSVLKDLWEWDGTTWTSVTLSTAPAARQLAYGAYDSPRKRLVLFGGFNGSSNFSDTWELPSNSPPTISSATFAGSAETVFVGKPVSLTVSASDPDGDSLTYLWTAAGPGSFTTSTASVTAFTPTTAGNYLLQLAVSDGNGGYAQALVNLTVQPSPTLVTQQVRMPPFVTRGQPRIPVRVLVRNDGASAATIARAGLRFTSAAGTDVSSHFAVYPLPSNPTSIAAGATATFTFQAGVTFASTTGVVDVDATFSATDAAGSSLGTDPGSSTASPTVGSPRISSQSLVWKQLTLTTKPTARYDVGSAYDEARGVGVFFGGILTAGPSIRNYHNDIWEFSDSKLTLRSADGASTAPVQRSAGLLAYDPYAGRTYMFSGGDDDGSVRYNDTWSWNGSSWTQLTADGATASPSKRFLGTLDFDRSRKELVTFSGRVSSNLNETWTFDGTSWTQRTIQGDPDSPGIRAAGRMVWTPERNALRLFGGSSLRNDLWEWNGTSWTDVTPTTKPAGRERHAFVHDGANSRFLLFSGTSSGTADHLDTWKLAGTTWTNISPTTQPTRREGAFAFFEAHSQRMVLSHGAQRGDGVFLERDDTWVLLADEANPRIDSVETLSTLPNTGQDFYITVNLRNYGTRVANITSLDPKFYDASGADVTGQFTITAVAGNPTSIGSLNGSAAWRFLVRATGTVAPGSYTIDATLAATDATSSADVSPGGGANAPSLVTFASPDDLPLQVVSLRVPPAVQRGQPKIPVRVSVENIGSTTATISSVSLRFSAGATNETTHYAVYALPSNPGSIAPGETSEFSLQVGTYFPATTGTIDVSASVAGTVDGLSEGEEFPTTSSAWTVSTPRISSAGLVWKQLSPSTNPSSRSDISGAYDHARGVSVLFGGYTGSTPTNDTWEFDGTAWSKVTADGATGSPTKRSGGRTAYDPFNGRTLLFGGGNSTNPSTRYNDTWSWNGSSWTQLIADGDGDSPSARYLPGLAFDFAREEFVLFGGGPSSGYLNDTWTFDGTAWTSQSPSSIPGTRYSQGQAWMPDRNVVRLFAGGAGGSPFRNDLWEWNGTNWLQLSPSTSPSARERHAFVHDGANSRFLLFSGVPTTTTNVRDTWKLVGTTWTNLSPTTQPTAREGAFHTFDDSAQRMLLFGGFNRQTSARNSETWVLVPDEAHPVIDSVVASSRIPTDGVTFRVRVNVRNYGANSATITTAGLKIYDSAGNDVTALFTITPDGSNPTTIDPVTGSEQLVFIVQAGGSVDPDDQFTFDATLGATDATTTDDVSPTGGGNTVSFSTATVAQRLPISVQAPPFVRRGQPRIPIRVSVENISTTTANVSSVALSFRSTGGADISTQFSYFYPPSNPTSIAAGETQTFTLQAGVTHAATTGTVYVDVTISGTDGVGSDLVTTPSAATATWSVGSPRISTEPFVWRQLSPATSPGIRSTMGMAYDEARGVTVLFAGENDGTKFNDTWEWTGTDWTLVKANGASGSPSTRLGCALEYDSKAGRVLMFGGVNGTFGGAGLTDTWSWNGSTWTQLTADGASSSPDRRELIPRGFDRARGEFLIFGGHYLSTTLNDTWVFDGSSWTEKNPSTSPSIRHSSGIAWWPERNVLTLFSGGNNGSPIRDDSWEWDGTNWTQTTSTGTRPSAREAMAFVRDGPRSRFLMYAGTNSPTTDASDTWEFDGTNWNNLNPSTNPGLRENMGYAYEAPAQRMLIYGGYNRNTDTYLSGTWAFLADEAAPLIDSVTAARTIPADGESFFVTLDLRNYGTHAANITTAGLKVYDSTGADMTSQFTFQPVDGNPASIPALTGAVEYRLLVAAASTVSTGEYTFDGTLTATDATSGNDVSPTGGANTPELVRAAAVLPLEIVSITAPPTVQRGQPRIPVLASVKNNGSTTVTLTTLALRLAAGMTDKTTEYAVWQSPSNATQIQAGETTDFTFQIGVFSAASTGAVSVELTAVGMVDGESQRDDFGPSPTTWTVSAPRISSQPLVWKPLSPSTSPGTRKYANMAYDEARGVSVFVGGHNGSVVTNDTWEFDGTAWTKRTADGASGSPAERQFHATAYDNTNGRVLLFAGNDGSNTNDLWSWNGSTWAQLTPSTAPPVRHLTGAAYDRVRQVLTIFGGSGNSGRLNDTWEFDGSSWTQKSTSSQPAIRHSPKLAWTPTRNLLTLFAGSNNGSPFYNDSWEWNGSVWTNVTPSGTKPTAREGPLFLFDHARSQLLTYGGCISTSADISDTWSYDGGTAWTNLNLSSNPGNREGHAFAYDALAQRIVVHGGVNRAASNFGDTWTLLADEAFPAIDSLSVVSPSPTENEAFFVTVNVRNYGTHSTDITTAGLKIYDSTGADVTSLFTISPSGENAGSIPSLTGAASLRFIVRAGNSVPPGRYTFDATLAATDANTFGDVSPTGGASTVSYVTLADPDDLPLRVLSVVAPPAVQRGQPRIPVRVSVQNAGSTTATLSSVALRFSDGTSDVTTQYAVFASPSNTSTIAAGQTSEFTFQVGVLWPAILGTIGVDASVAGTVGTSSAQDDFATTSAQWAVTSPRVSSQALVWRQLSPSSVPSHRFNAAFAFDDARGVLVMFGGITSTGPTLYNDTWEFDGINWTLKAADGASGSPVRRRAATMTYDPSSGKTVLFGGSNSNNSVFYNDTWEWNGTAWTQLTTDGASGSPAKRAFVGTDYDPIRGYMLMFGGFNGGNLSDTWAFDGTAWTQLSPASSPGARIRHRMAWAGARGKATFFGGTNGTQFNETWDWNGSTWTNTSPATKPSAREDADFRWDGARSVFYLFGGQLISSSLNDTWSFTGTQWTNLNPTTKPPARGEAVSAFDSSGQRLLLAQGVERGGSSAKYSDTWTFVADEAQPQIDSISAVSPSPTGGEGFFVDVSLRNYGTHSADITTAGLKIYDSSGNDVTSQFTIVPAGNNPDSVGSFTGTATLRFIVRAGGSVTSGRYTFDATLSATDSSSSGDVSPTGGANTIAYVTLSDPDDQKLQLLSVAAPPFVQRGQPRIPVRVSVKNNGATTSTLTSVALRFSSGSTDVTTQYGVHALPANVSGVGAGQTQILTFQVGVLWPATTGTIEVNASIAGTVDSVSVRDDFATTAAAWTAGTPRVPAAGLTWKQITASGGPGARAQIAGSYDAARGVFVVFGGTPGSGSFPNDTHEFDGVRWTETIDDAAPGSPGGRGYYGFAYDSARGVSVLFGGGVCPTDFNDVWEYNGVSWTQRLADDGARSPGRLDTMLWSYDTVARKFLTFGGGNCSTGSNGTFEWDGTQFTTRSPLSSPSARFRVSGTFDPIAGRTVLFGGSTGSSLNDTWEWDGTNWTRTNNGSSNSPAIRESHALYYDGVRRRVALFGGSTGSVVGGTDYNDVHDYDGSNWTLVSPGTAPLAGRSEMAIAYDSAGQRLLVFGGYSRSNGAILSDTWALVADEAQPQMTAVTAPESASGSFVVTMTARNVGTRSAAVDLAGLRIYDSSGNDVTGQFTVTPRVTNPASIADLTGTATLEFDVLPPSGTSGIFTLDGTLQASDGGDDVSPTGGAFTVAFTSLDVPASPTYAFGPLVAPSTVSRGQVFSASVDVTNTGQATALITTGELTFSGTGLSGVPAGTFPTSLAPGASATFAFDVTVSSSASTGDQTATFTLTAVNQLSSADASRTATLTAVVVQTTPEFAVSALSAPSPVSRGQLFVASIDVTNTGDATAGITSTSLTFSGSGLTASARGTNPTSLAGGATGTFTFDVTAGASATTGSLTPTFTIDARDRNSDEDASASGNVSPRLTVHAVPVFSFSALTAPSPVSRGQVFVASVRITNTGDATADITSTSLAFSGTGIVAVAHVSNPTSLAGGAGGTFVYSVTVGGSATVGSATPTVTVAAKDRNSSSDASGSSSLSPAVLVQSAPAYTLGALTAPSPVSRGQAFTASLTITNTGGATADITSTALAFSGTGVTAIARNTNPVSLAGGAAGTFTYDVTVSATATAGVLTPTLTLKAKDRNTRSDASAVSALLPKVTVQQLSAFTYSALSAPSPISRGQAFTASLTITNTGGATADITSTALTFSGTGLTATARGTNPASLAGGNSGVFTYDIVASAGASTGPQTATVEVSAKDSNTNNDASGVSTLTPAITVHAPPAFAFGSLTSPSPVSRGQVFSASIDVTNTGDATADITATALSFTGTGLTIAARGTNPATLAGGTAATFTYDITATAGASTGSLLATLGIDASDGNSGSDASASSALSPALVVQTPPSLSAGSLSVSSLVQGQSVTATVVLTNTGGATADISATSLTFSGSGVLATAQPDNPASIAGGSTATFRYSVSASSVATPSQRAATLTVAAGDRNSSFDASLTQLLNPALNVLPSASLAIESIAVGSPTVSLGQRSVSVRMTLVNTGSTTVTLTTASLRFTGTSDRAGDYTVRPASGNSVAVTGGTTAGLDFLVDVAATATTGLVTIDGSASGTSAGVTFVAPAARRGASWTVRSPGILVLESISAPSRVSAGQLVEVFMTVRNSGEGTALVTGAFLTFTGAGGTDRSGDYGVALADGNPDSIAGGASISLRLQVGVSGGAEPGDVVLDGVVAGADADSGLESSDGSAATTAVWTVLAPSSLTIAQPSVSAGQVVTGAPFTVFLRLDNQGDQDVLETTATLRFYDSSGRDATAAFSVARSVPVTVPARDSILVEMSVSAGTAAAPGRYSIDAEAAGLDGLTGAPVFAVGAAARGSIELLAPAPVSARLAIASLAAPSAVLPGSTFDAIVSLANSGGTGARILVTAITFTNALGTDATRRFGITPAATNPELVPARGSISLAYRIVAPSSTTTESFDLDAGVDAIDAVTGEPLAAATSSANRARVTIRPSSSPAALRLLSLALPATASQGSVFRVTMTLENGSANDTTVTTAGLTFARSAGEAGGEFTVSSDLTSPRPLVAGGRLDLGFRVQVAGSATTGPVRVDGVAAGFDSVTFRPLAARGADVQPAPLVITEGIRAALLELVSISSPPALALGQSGFVDVTVRNTGINPAVINAAGLTILGPGFEDVTHLFTVTAAPGNAGIVDGGQTIVLRFILTPGAGAPASGILIGASIVANDGLTGEPAEANGSQTTPSTTVRTASAPLASAGPAQLQRVTQLARLDGSASSDPDASGADSPPLVYHWSFLSVPSGSRVTTASFSVNGTAVAARPNFQPDRKGSYVLQLVVAKGTLRSEPSETQVDVLNSKPIVALATEAIELTAGTTATLTASGADADREDVLTYAWQLVTRPPASALTTASAFTDRRSAVTGFRADVPGAFVVSVTVNDGADASEPAQLTVLAVPDEPTGPYFIGLTDGQVVDEDETDAPGVQLDVAARRRTLDGTPIELYVNDVGVGIASPDATGLVGFVAVTLPIGQTSRLTLRAGTQETSIRLTVPSALPPGMRVSVPGALAGGPRVIVLDASGSFSPAGQPVVYQWRLASRPTGARDLASDAARIDYDARVPGEYEFELTVSSPGARPVSRIVRFAVASVPPAADAGPDRQVLLSRFDEPSGLDTALEVELDGTASFSPNGLPISYSWRLVEAPDLSGPGSSALVSLGSPLSPRPAIRFTSDTRTGTPAGPLAAAGRYAFELTVSDGSFESTDRVVITAGDPNYLLPRADAGIDRTVAASRGPGGALLATIPDPTLQAPNNLRAHVRLDGRESVDSQGRPLTYRWRVVRAAERSAGVVLADAATAFPTFVPDAGGRYVFELVVNNGIYDSAPSLVEIAVMDSNAPPTALAFVEDLAALRTSSPSRPLLTFDVGARVTLNGAFSSDSDAAHGQLLTYRWAQTAGAPATLEPTADAASVSFAAAEPSRLAFELTVTDPEGATDQAAVEVLVRGSDPMPSLALEATATSTSERGESFESGFRPGLPRSLRVTVPSTVTLSASLAGTPAGARYDFLWRQLAGPVVALSNAGERGTPLLGSQTRFSPTTSRVHVFSFAAFPLDRDGNRTGQYVERFVRVVVDTAVSAVAAPSGSAAPAIIPLAGSTSQRTIQLDASGSRHFGVLAGSGRPLAFSWSQVAGPRGVFTDPFAARTSFLAPAFEPGAAPREYVFELTVDVTPPGDRSEPFYVQVSQTGTGSTPPATGTTDPRRFVRIFIGGAPSSELLPLGTPPYVFTSISIPGSVTTGTAIVLTVVDVNGSPVPGQPPVQTSTIVLVSGGPGSITLAGSNTVVLDPGARGTTVSGVVLEAFVPAPAGSIGSGGGGGGGCNFQLESTRSASGGGKLPDALPMLLPALMLRRRRGRRES